MSYILKIENMTKRYNDYTAVDNLSLQVKKGEIYGFLGPNGAGKTTTIECVLGLKCYTEGQIHLDTREGYEKIGVQLQETMYHRKIKVCELIKLMSSFYKDTIDSTTLINRFRLKSKLNDYVENLSGGEKQKLTLLLALINDPEIVFLDELTTGLDPESRHEVWHILKELNKKGLTIFMTSHYMDEVTKLCDRITIISKGKEKITGTIDDVISKSGCPDLESAYLKYIHEEIKDESINCIN